MPLGGRKVRGTVVTWPAPTPDPEIRVKPIEALLRTAPSLPPDVLELTRFVADYYLCSWGEARPRFLPIRAAEREAAPCAACPSPTRTPFRHGPRRGGG